MPPLPIVWDSPGLFWDSGLQWDVNAQPSLGDATPYLDLVTSEHSDKPKYMAMLEVFLQPVADILQVQETFPGLYDLDVAVGVQLDAVGLWVGQSRFLTTPLTGVYFSFDDAELGFDLGTWLGPFDPTTGLVTLPDDTYRILLKAVIAANQWNGTIPQAYEIWNTLFQGTLMIMIIDNQDMSMDYGVIPNGPLDAVTLALLTGGYLSLKPAGVRINNYFVPSEPGTPFFGFDAFTDAIAGFDTGSWATPLTPT
jgi:hypothetical protein